MGPLAGLRVVEIVGLGPGPFAGMVLADLGAEVLRVDRLTGADPAGPTGNVLHRGKRSIALDLKHPSGVDALLRLVDQADALIDVFRPGVAERLGFGPDVCLARNPRLIYGRLTGWGQEGPWAGVAGHDIDYIALAGALDPLGRAGDPPTPPINVLGDFAGGGMLLALGIACAAWERSRSGLGQVVDAAMIDGAALLMAPFITGRQGGGWGPRGTNMLDTAAPFYEVYETADGGWIAVGAIEPQFYDLLLAGLGLNQADLPDRGDKAEWPGLKERLAAVFRTRTRAQWCEIFDGTDACVAPVLEPSEVAAHPHHRDRGTFVAVDGIHQPAPAPRFSRTTLGPPGRGSRAGADADDALVAWGFTEDEVAHLRHAGALA
ncbi:MAG: CaiB/BaiF CoA transferase family protein [Acidimicrobiales bacterium]